MKIKMRSINSEWIVLNRYFGEDYICKMFNNFISYKEIRSTNTYQNIYNELLKLDY